MVGKSEDLFNTTTKNRGEGILAKKASSSYQIGKRSNDWLKIKNIQQEEAIIVGITESKNGREPFGALLLGQYDGKKLKYIGKCGSGFTDASLKELYSKFKRDFVENSFLSEKPKLLDKIQ